MVHSDGGEDQIFYTMVPVKKEKSLLSRMGLNPQIKCEVRVVKNTFSHIGSGEQESRARRLLSLILRRYYLVKNKTEVLDFISDNVHLIPLIRQAPAHIVKSFGRTVLELRITQDPDEGEKQLMIVIKTSLSALEARQKLQALDDEWWLEASGNADPDGKLGVHVEFT